MYSVWFTDNRPKLALNAKKINYAIFYIGLKFDGIYDNLYFNIHDVKQVDFVKFLGILIDYHFNCVNDKIIKGYELPKRCFYVLKSFC